MKYKPNKQKKIKSLILAPPEPEFKPNISKTPPGLEYNTTMSKMNYLLQVIY